MGDDDPIFIVVLRIPVLLRWIWNTGGHRIFWKALKNS